MYIAKGTTDPGEDCFNQINNLPRYLFHITQIQWS